MTDNTGHSESADANTGSQESYPNRCDLVLKGGITSGVVYPAAIAWFAQKYQLHQIGGTSAGAIAAGAAAAAQLGKVSGNCSDAFERLKRLPDDLGKVVDGKENRLFRMFRPTLAADRLFDTVTAAAGGGKIALLRVVGTAIRKYPLAVVLGVIPMLVGAAISPVSPSVLGCLLQILLFAVGLMLGVAIALLWTLLKDASAVLPRQGWGLCAGVRRDSQGNEDPAALSSWLQGYLNELAGLHAGDVLTFGHLWRGDGKAATGNIEPRARAISFKAMTTALNLQRPFIVPFETSDGRDLYFREDDLLDVLPRGVVAHMRRKADEVEQPKDADDRAKVARYRDEGYHRVPSPWDFPVVLAVRMSLSFPLLLSAVRFHKPDYSRDQEDHMQPLWFSDGGICSNLPVHLFDAPLPTHPTFTINLVEPNPEGRKQEDVFVPTNAQSGKEGPRNYFHETEGLAGVAAFLSTIVDSARNWVDNGQLRLPGYRERVGSVVVHPNEGGLNLSMPANVISTLSARGELVAQKLHDAFSQPIWTGESNGWDRHQWIRLRNQLGALSSYFGDIDAALKTLKRGLPDLQQMVTRHPGTNTAQDQSEAQKNALCDLLKALEKVMADPSLKAVIDKSEGELRIRPR